MDELKKKVGLIIKKLREQKGITQPQLAVLLGSEKHKRISSWEVGQSFPRVPDLILMAEIFEISTDKIMGVDLKKSPVSLTPPPTKPGEESQMMYHTLEEIERELIKIADALIKINKEREILLSKKKLYELALTGLKAEHGPADQ